MPQRCRIFITGASGQDARVLLSLLRNSNVDAHVVAVSRGKYQLDDPIFRDFSGASFSLELVQSNYGSDFFKLIEEAAPDLIFHLGASTFVEDSWKNTKVFHGQMIEPALDILEYCRINSLCKVFLASSSEIFGDPHVSPQNEETPRCARNPYGLSKMTVFELSRIYRKRYALFIVNGIFYNHESFYRGDRFVTMKICSGLKSFLSSGKSFSLGNIEARRDWSSAWDFMRGAFMALKHGSPFDYVFASGVSRSIKDWINVSTQLLSLETRWQGEGMNERLVDLQSGGVILSIDPQYYRPEDSQLLLGDCSRAHAELNWRAQFSFRDIVAEMLANEPPSSAFRQLT